MWVEKEKWGKENAIQWAGLPRMPSRDERRVRAKVSRVQFKDCQEQHSTMLA